MSFPIPVKLTVSGDVYIPIKLAGDQSIGVGLNTEIRESPIHNYEGPYEATPSASTQAFSMYGKFATEDFVVNPIPSNYGLITWDGGVLTVS